MNALWNWQRNSKFNRASRAEKQRHRDNVNYMPHLKNYLRSTMTTERMSGLALMHVHKDTELDAERIIHQFSRQKNRRLALLFSA